MHRQLVYLHCTDRTTVEYYRQCAIGLRAGFGRWDMLAAAPSDKDPLSLDVEIPDFREGDLALLRALPGVVEVGTFEARIPLPDPLRARREYFAARPAA